MKSHYYISICCILLVECAGVYDRKYTSSMMMVIVDAQLPKRFGKIAVRREVEAVVIQMLQTSIGTCCKWVKKHPEDAQKSKEIAKIPIHYEVYTNKLVRVIVDGAEVLDFYLGKPYRKLRHIYHQQRHPIIFASV